MHKIEVHSKQVINNLIKLLSNKDIKYKDMITDNEDTDSILNTTSLTNLFTGKLTIWDNIFNLNNRQPKAINIDPIIGHSGDMPILRRQYATGRFNI